MNRTTSSFVHENQDPRKRTSPEHGDFIKTEFDRHEGVAGGENHHSRGPSILFRQGRSCARVTFLVCVEPLKSIISKVLKPVQFADLLVNAAEPAMYNTIDSADYTVIYVFECFALKATVHEIPTFIL